MNQVDRVATLLREWIPSVLQAVATYMSVEDTEKGSRWFDEISRELQESSFGIVCLTRTNMNRAWLNYEAGAIANKVGKTNVAGLLISMEETELTDPLVLFQHTRPTKDDMSRLVKTLNQNLDDNAQLTEGRLKATFERWWPEFAEKYETALATASDAEEPERRSDRDILEEILRLNRSLATHGFGRAPENYLLRELLEQGFEAKLTERERKILVLHYGLDDGEAMSEQQIGELFGLNEAAIRELRRRALSKLL